jgi:hypothetical protein
MQMITVCAQRAGLAERPFQASALPIFHVKRSRGVQCLGLPTPGRSKVVRAMTRRLRSTPSPRDDQSTDIAARACTPYTKFKMVIPIVPARITSQLLTRALSDSNGRQCTKQYDYIAPQAPVPHVPSVQMHALFVTNLRSPAYLPEAGNSGSDE